jgi:hypothetical protein
MYKLLNNAQGQAFAVLRIEDEAGIPLDTGNRDYQAYLQWLSEGNEPEPAEEQQ